MCYGGQVLCFMTFRVKGGQNLETRVEFLVLPNIWSDLTVEAFSSGGTGDQRLLAFGNFLKFSEKITKILKNQNQLQTIVLIADPNPCLIFQKL